MKLNINGIPGSLELTEISCCRLVRTIKRLFGIPVRYELTYNEHQVPGEYMLDIDGHTLFEADTKKVVTQEFLLEALEIRYVLTYPGLQEPLILEKCIGSDIESLSLLSRPTYVVYYSGLLEVPGRFWFDKDQRLLLVAGKYPREVITSRDIQELLGLELKLS
jgi:hypothetical protein